MDEELIKDLITALNENTFKLEALYNRLISLGDDLRSIKPDGKFQDRVIERLDTIADLLSH
jgi:hypothetical protein